MFWTRRFPPVRPLNSFFTCGDWDTCDFLTLTIATLR